MIDQLREIHPLLPSIGGLAALLVLAILFDLLAKRLLLRIVVALARRSQVSWDDVLVDQKVFRRLAQIAPALVILSGIGLVPDLNDELVQLIRNVTSGYLVLMLTLSITAAISAANTIYETYPIARERPMKGVAQLLQIIIVVIGGVMVVAAVMDRSPLLLLSGLGAMTAILLLVFKDTIMGLVASVQLTANDMVRVGDWIEMPQYGADGDVIDVALHTVKIQNWDKTITTVPTHKLIAESFKNWRGMSASGGRRIKRSVHIDKNSIRFLSREEIQRFKGFALLTDYIHDKEQELADYNSGLSNAGAASVNQRNLTNVGTFRAYILNYLRQHPDIHHDNMTLLVRQLPPGPEGLPIEIYCFTTTTGWVEYEDIQADIFDHLLAVAGEFGLRLFQKPAGTDLAALQFSRETEA